MKMKLKQSFEREQPKSVKDFLITQDKPQIKTRQSDDNNFFTKLAQRSQAA